MKIKAVSAGCFIILIFAVSCTHKTEDDFKIQFGYKKYEKKFGLCDSSGSDCASIALEYPEIKHAHNSFVKDSITNYIMNSLLSNYFNTKKTKSLDEMAGVFFKDYEKMQKEFSDYTLPWDITSSISVIYNDKSIISLQSEFYRFLGGAHGNSGVYFANFNLQNGKQLSLSDVLISGYEKDLNSIGEKLFRKDKNMKSDENLEEAGFWFEDNTFALNENFGIKSDGLVFYFNSYEIAPYAMGPTEILIPFGVITGLIKHDGLLSRVVVN